LVFLAFFNGFLAPSEHNKGAKSKGRYGHRRLSVPPLLDNICCREASNNADRYIHSLNKVVGGGRSNPGDWILAGFPPAIMNHLYTTFIRLSEN
jgi:hypothetical protein